MGTDLDSVSRELFDRLSEREDAEIGALNDLYRAALEQTIERVTGDLPRDEEGRLVPDPGALARLRRSFERFGDSEGASLLLEQHVERVASALSRQVEVIGQGWARLGEDPLTDDELALSQLVRASWLDQMGELSRYHHAQLRDAVMRQALARSTPHLLRSEMRRLSRTSAAQADRMHHDALIGYSRSVIDESSKARGFEYFEYRGPDDSANRPFCDKHVGRIYTREEIEKLDNGQTSNVMLTGGGYRCRHHWRPVRREWLDDEVWEEKRPDTPEAVLGESLVGGTGADPSSVYQTWSSSPRMVAQQEPYSCGAACTRQFLLDRGIDIDEATLYAYASAPKVTPDATHYLMTVHDIKRALEQEGGIQRPIIAGTIRPLPTINQLASFGRAFTPFMALQGGHWIIVDEITADVVKIRDPWGEQGAGSAQGLEAELTHEQFMTAWTNGGHTAVVVR